jgi:cytochrome c5
VKLAVMFRSLVAAVAIMGSMSVWADSELVERIKPVGEICMAGDECAAAVVEVAAGPRTGKQLYDTKCMACHASGVAGAPKLGDSVVWGDRVNAKGLDGLFNSAWNGINAMPPKGTCNDCTEDEIKSAIKYMTES